MRKVCFLLLVCLLNPFVGYALAVDEKVIIYNWDDYIPEGVVEEFTKETGIKVEYSTYGSTELMLTKLQILEGRGYDVIVSSSNLVEKLYKEGLLRPLDIALIPNVKHLDENLLNRPYDPHNKYSLPYVWGSIGLAVNTDVVAANHIRSWKDLWDKKWLNKLLLIDDMRSVFHMALKVNGHSANSVNEEEISQAYRLLRQLMSNVRMFSLEQEGDEFINGTVSLGSLWNGEAVRAQEATSKVDFIYPKEGAFFWMDSFAVPSGSANVENAHAFINFMLRPEIAVRCVKELNYATPNLEGKALLDEETRNNIAIFPPADYLKKAEFQRDVGDKLSLYKSYWDRLKTGK